MKPCSPQLMRLCGLPGSLNGSFRHAFIEGVFAPRCSTNVRGKYLTLYRRR